MSVGSEVFSSAVFVPSSRRRHSRGVGPMKIRVNSINPGIVAREGSQAAGFIGSDFEAGAIAQTPLGRTVQVDDIAGVATFPLRATPTRSRAN